MMNSLLLSSCQHESYAPRINPVFHDDTSYWCHKRDEQAFDLCQIELELTSLTNEFRYQNGLPPLRHDPALAFVAYHQSRRAAESGTISHAGFPRSRQLLLQKFDPDRAAMIQAENLLRLKTSEKDPKSIARRLLYYWQGSPSHRKQLLGPHRAHGASLVFDQDFVFAAAMFQ